MADITDPDLWETVKSLQKAQEAREIARKKEVLETFLSLPWADVQAHKAALVMNEIFGEGYVDLPKMYPPGADMKKGPIVGER